MGGVRVTLRISDPSAGDTDRQWGLQLPRRKWSNSPAAVQSIKAAADGTRHWEILFSARGLRAAAEPYGVTDLANWLLTSQGVFTAASFCPSSRSSANRLPMANIVISRLPRSRTHYASI